MQLLFYATPIVYSINDVPPAFQWILKLNPMSYLIEGYRAIFYDKVAPNFAHLGISLGLAVAVCFIGYQIFRKLEKGFAEQL